MVLYIIIIIEGLLFLYNFLGFMGILPYLQIFKFSNGYISIAKAIVAKFSILFAIMLIILGVYLLWKRWKDKTSMIDKDNVFDEMVGFVIFFGIMLVFAFL